MRTFTYAAGAERKFVVLEVLGSRVVVQDKKADGSTVRKEKEFRSEAEAQTACDRMAQELLSRGYAERPRGNQTHGNGSASAPPRPVSAQKRGASKPASLGLDQVDGNLSRVLDEEDAAGEDAAPVLPRLGALPGVAGAPGEGEPKKKKSSGKKKKKRKKAAGADDGLDKRVLAGVGVVGAAIVALVAYLVYDTALKPASIVGNWKGARTVHEISKSLTHTRYQLILDEKKNATMTLQDSLTSTGTYALNKDRLVLNLKDEEGEPTTITYKISLGHTTLDLYDPSDGEKVVQLVRQGSQPPSAVAATKPAPAAPKDVAGEANAAGDAQLVSVSFSPKDSAFKLLYPPGWESKTGSRPDNTYSWVRFTKGSAKIQVYADVAGSLMSGSDVGRDHEEGSVAAPVHNAHVLYKEKAAEEYTDYQESEPTVFKGSRLGEGRIAAFTASAGGLFGGKLQGYRVTLLTGNRRITVLCECPSKEFDKLKPTFLALCRSLSY